MFATTGEVPRLVAEELGYDGAPASLAAQLTVEDDFETGTLRFTTEQENAEDAVRIADAFADETVRYLSQRQEELQQARQTNVLEDVQQLEAEIRDLDQQIADQLAVLNANRPAGAPFAEADSITRARRDAAVREYSTAYEAYRSLVAEGAGALNLTTLERAQPVPVQTGGFTPPRTRASRVPIAAGIGALLGAAVALLVERLDAKIRDRRKAEEAFGASVVAELPTLTRKQRTARLVVGPEEHNAAAEAFRSLRTSITFMAAGGQPLADDDRVGAILVTSPSPAEGKTTIAVNLAAAFAETGRSVVLVNADFRRPLASKVLTDERPTLPAALDGVDRLDPSAVPRPDEGAGRPVARPLPARRDARRSHPSDGSPGHRAHRTGRRSRHRHPAARRHHRGARVRPPGEGRRARRPDRSHGDRRRPAGRRTGSASAAPSRSRWRSTTPGRCACGGPPTTTTTAAAAVATRDAAATPTPGTAGTPAEADARANGDNEWQEIDELVERADTAPDADADDDGLRQRALPAAMTSASAVYRLNRANVVAWAGLAAIAVYFAVLMHAVEAWPYDQWMVLILAPALLAIGTPIIVSVTRQDEEPLTTLIVVALVVKLAASFVRYFVAFSLYGSG